MGGETAPAGCPVTDQCVVFCSGGSGKVCDSRVDPPDSVRDICTIDRDTIADEEIFRDIVFDPFSISNLLLNAPSTISNCPDLLRGFRYRLAERKGGKEDQKQDEKRHVSY
jgi:hypothetical protein